MLPRKNRIDTQLFKKIQKEGKKAKNQCFFCVYLRTEAPIPQFAVVVGKKKLPRAVDRNRLRRKVYGALSPHTNSSENIAALLFANPIILTDPSIDISACLDDIFKKVRL